MEQMLVISAQEFSEERFTKRVLFQKKASVVFLLNFMPGQELPPHKHPGSQVYILVLQGSGTITVDGEHSDVEKGSVIFCENEQLLSFKNSGTQPVSLYVVINSAS